MVEYPIAMPFAGGVDIGNGYASGRCFMTRAQIDALYELQY
jgi:hypothetical protein